MMVFDMLTADAANRHGHEFSLRPTQSPAAGSSSSSSTASGRTGGNGAGTSVANRAGFPASQEQQGAAPQPWLIHPRLPFRMVAGVPYRVRSPGVRAQQQHAQAAASRASRVRQSVGGVTSVMSELKEEPEEEDEREKDRLKQQERERDMLQAKVGPLFGWGMSSISKEMSLENLRIPGAFQRTPPSLQREREKTEARNLAGVKPLVIPLPAASTGPESSVLLGSAGPNLIILDSPTVPVAPLTPTASSSVRTASITETTTTPATIKREHRAKTRYEFAHPPPTSSRQGSSKQLRVFAQMHLLKASGFHKPVYEIVPVSGVGSSKPGSGFKHKFRRLGIGGKGSGSSSLATDDWAVMKVAAHPTMSLGGGPIALDEGGENQSLDSRDVLGVISRTPFALLESEAAARQRNVNILVDNAIWKGSFTGEGVYDLKSTATDMPDARWYVPKAQRSSTGGMPRASKLYFVPMHTSTRKHPTMACVSREHLDVYDTGSASSTQDGGATENETLRHLIIVSSFWVMASEGWSTHLNISGSSATETGTKRQSVASFYKPQTADIIASQPLFTENTTPLARTSTEPETKPFGRKRRSTVTQSESTAPLSRAPARGLRSISLGRSISLSGRRKTVDEGVLDNSTEARHLFPDASPQVIALDLDARPESSDTIIHLTPPKSSSPIPQIFKPQEVDPTAQFRHLMSLDARSGSQSSSPSPSVRVLTHLVTSSSVSAASSLAHRSPNLMEASASVALERRGRAMQPIVSPAPANTTVEEESVGPIVRERRQSPEMEEVQPKRRTQSISWGWRVASLALPALPSISDSVSGLFGTSTVAADASLTETDTGDVRDDQRLTLEGAGLLDGGTRVASVGSDSTFVDAPEGLPAVQAAQSIKDSGDRDGLCQEEQPPQNTPIDDRVLATRPPLAGAWISKKDDADADDSLAAHISTKLESVKTREPLFAGSWSGFSNEKQPDLDFPGHENVRPRQEQQTEPVDQDSANSSSDELELFGVSQRPGEYWRDFDRLRNRQPWRSSTPVAAHPPVWQSHRTQTPSLQPPPAVQVPPRSSSVTPSTTLTTTLPPSALRNLADDGVQPSHHRSKTPAKLQRPTREHLPPPRTNTTTPRSRLLSGFRRSLSKNRAHLPAEQDHHRLPALSANNDEKKHDVDDNIHKDGRRI